MKVAFVFAVLFRGLLFDGLVFVAGVGVPVPERSCSRTLLLHIGKSFDENKFENEFSQGREASH